MPQKPKDRCVINPDGSLLLLSSSSQKCCCGLADDFDFDYLNKKAPSLTFPKLEARLKIIFSRETNKPKQTKKKKDAVEKKVHWAFNMKLFLFAWNCCSIFDVVLL